MKKHLVLAVALFSFGLAYGQETTSTINGHTTDENGLVLKDVSITIIHVPTGKVITSRSNSKGIFNIPNLQAGGPYIVKVDAPNHPEEKLENINLSLGNNPDLDFVLKGKASEISEVLITATNKKSNGDGINLGKAQLSTLPTLGRSLSDFTRLTPQSNNNSFAGSNFRYNNITLDGAVNNDAIGFSNSFGGVSGGGQSGAAGAGSRSNPYSLDAIQDVSVQLAPYDVKIGNLTGGSVNAVTKSGTNETHGSAYFYGRNQSLVGRSVDGLRTKIGSDFHDIQFGASVGGALIKNKAFFFLNLEQTDRQEPTFYNAGDPGSAISLIEAQTIQNNLKTNYGYDVGTYGAYKIFTKSKKLFARLDFNLGDNNSLMVRANYVDGTANNLERTSTNFQFSSTDFTQYDKNLNLVTELKTKFSDNLHNDLLLTYTHIHEYRDFPGTLFPFIDIDNGRIWVGTWREASIYNMTQKTFEFTDNINWTKGIHNFTLGTHNEFYNITYGFINSFNGRWEYSGGLNSFLNNQPSRIRGVYTLPGSGLANNRDAIYNNPPNPFKVNLLSTYLQDEISVTKDLKMTPGVRIDYSYLDNQPITDPQINSLTTNTTSNPPTFTHTPFADLSNKWLGKAVLSPRFSFVYDVLSNKKIMLRGGSGVFVGRMPFAWLGYAYTLNGNVYGNIDYRPGGKTVPLATDPSQLVSSLSASGAPASAYNTRELDIIDNNFKLPRIWRSNLAVEFNLGKGYKVNLDGLFTETLYDVQFQQINLQDQVQYYSTGPTQTPVYVGGKVGSQYSNIYFLTNTKQGKRYNLTAQFSKYQNNIQIGNHSLNINATLAYTYGRSWDLSNGIRNSFQSNYEVNPSINPNSPELSYSNFDLRHRVVSTLSTGLKWNDFNKTSVSFFFSTQSGSPYSLIYQSAPFNNSSNASLPYIPKNQGDINFADVKDGGGNVIYSAGQQWSDVNNFINNDKYLKTRKGQYAERNGMRTPWNTDLDMKLMHEFTINQAKKQSLQISMDVFNVLNLIDHNWGQINFITNVNNYTVNFLKFVNDANGNKPGAPSTGYQPTYNFVRPNVSNGQYYTVDPLNSRWQAQLGVKFIF